MKKLTPESLERAKDEAFAKPEKYLNFWNCDKCKKAVIVEGPQGSLIDSRCECGRSFMGYWRDRK